MTMPAGAADAPPPHPDPGFDLAELRVLGNNTLEAKVIEAAVYPFTGPGKHMADVEAARAALERAYHDHGFGTVFVDIPEQTVDRGIVRLHVTEGRLRQVGFWGGRFHDMAPGERVGCPVLLGTGDPRGAACGRGGHGAQPAGAAE